MKLKIISITSSILAAAAVSTAMASTCMPVWNGGYIGLHGGYMTGDSKVTKVDTFDLTTPRSSRDLSGRGGAGGVHLGWGRMFSQDKVYLGLELKADASGLKGEEKVNDAEAQSTKLEQRSAFGGNVRIGMKCNNVLPYLKVGAVSSEWRVKSNLNAVGFTNKAMKKHRTGLDVGLGVDMPCGNKMWVGAEYMYTSYERLNFSTTAQKQSVRPQTSAVMVRLTYKGW